MHYLDKPRRPSIGTIGWVRIQSATRTKLGQISTGVDRLAILHPTHGYVADQFGIIDPWNGDGDPTYARRNTTGLHET
jgi:hypothetical protein